MMKKLTIGRGRDCKLVINDTSDVVSRHQAVIAFTWLGRMTIYDTSVNGTYLNGTRIKKGEGVPVTRGDEVNFGKVWKLDWDTVRNPYIDVWRNIVIALVALLIVGGAVTLYMIYGTDDADKQEQVLPTDDGIQAADDAMDVDAEEEAAVENTVVEKKAKPKARPRKKDAGQEEESMPQDEQPAEETPAATEAPIIF